MLAWIHVNTFAKAVIGASWMTALDLVIEPLAAGPLGFWIWAESGRYYGIPAGNFAGWFAVSLLLFLVLRGSPEKNRRATLVGLSIILFFTIIAIGRLIAGPAFAGVVLSTAHAAMVTAGRKFD